MLCHLGHYLYYVPCLTEITILCSQFSNVFLVYKCVLTTLIHWSHNLQCGNVTFNFFSWGFMYNCRLCLENILVTVDMIYSDYDMIIINKVGSIVLLPHHGMYWIPTRYYLPKPRYIQVTCLVSWPTEKKNNFIIKIKIITFW